MKKVHSQEKKEPYNTLNRTKQTKKERERERERGGGGRERERERERENNNKINIVTVSLGKSVKNFALGREKGALQYPKQNRTDNIEEELSENGHRK